MQRRRLGIGFLVTAALLASGCGTPALEGGHGGGAGTARFRPRDVPRPFELEERLARVCLAGTPSGAGGTTGGGAGDLRDCALPSDSTSGGAVFDFSGDGRPDIIWTSPLANMTAFLENRGGWKFRDVTDIIVGDTDLDRVNGVAVGDVDNDGDGDIYFTRENANSSVLLVNGGGGRFTNEADERGVAMNDGFPHFGASAVFGDYDGDGWLDLHTTEHLLREIPAREGHMRLFRNLGGEGKPGVFEDVTFTSRADAGTDGLLLAFQSMFNDVDGDGRLDLYVVANHNHSRIFLNNGDGTFRDGSAEYPLTVDESGMGVSVGDVSGDGRPDIFISAASQSPAPRGETRICADLDPTTERLGGDSNNGNLLFVADGDGYIDMTDRYGVRHGGWGWGTVMADFANSGRLGIVQVANRSIAMASSVIYCLYDGTTQPVVRYWEPGVDGNLTENSFTAGIRGVLRPKSPATGDLDGDGDDDLIIFESLGPPLLFENTTRDAGKRAITVAFGPGGHPANAVITVNFTDGSTPIVRIAGVANGVYSARYSDEIIGLGERAGIVANLSVKYADGRTLTIDRPEPGKKVELP